MRSAWALKATWENFDKSKNVKPWIFGIASNKLNDFLRRKYKIAANISYEENENVIHNELPGIKSSVEEFRPILYELIEQLKEKHVHSHCIFHVEIHLETRLFFLYKHHLYKSKCLCLRFYLYSYLRKMILY